MRPLCMPQGLSSDELPKLEALICTARPVRRGEALYRSGDVFDNLYAVRSGSLKTTMAHRDGREQVTGLRLAVGRGLIGMVLADLYTAISGIGYLIVRTAATYQVNKMFVPIVTLGLLGVTLTALLRVLERAVAPWTSAQEQD